MNLVFWDQSPEKRMTIISAYMCLSIIRIPFFLLSHNVINSQHGPGNVAKHTCYILDTQIKVERLWIISWTLSMSQGPISWCRLFISSNSQFSTMKIFLQKYILKHPCLFLMQQANQLNLFPEATVSNSAIFILLKYLTYYQSPDPQSIIFLH